MKADKGTDMIAEAENPIRYETLLSALVQKKISAIKRDCETKRLKKQKRREKNCLSSLIFGKRADGRQRNKTADNHCIINETNSATNPTTAVQLDHLAVMTTNRTVMDDSNDDVCVSMAANIAANESHIEQDATVVGKTIDFSVLSERQKGDKEFSGTDHQQSRALNKSPMPTTYIDDDAADDVDDDGGGGGGSVVGDDGCSSNGDNTVVIENAYYQQRPSTNSLTCDEPCAKSNSDNKIAKTRGDCDVELPGILRTTNSKSSIVISKTDEVKIRLEASPQPDGSDTHSIISAKHTTHSAPTEPNMPFDSAVIYTAKSISAQCSPLFTQRQNSHNHPTPSSTTKSATNFLTETAQRLFARHQRSDDSVNETFSHRSSHHIDGNDDSMKTSNETDEPNSNRKLASKMFCKTTHDATKSTNIKSHSQNAHSLIQSTANKLATGIVGAVGTKSQHIAQIERSIDSDDDSCEQQAAELAIQSMRNCAQPTNEQRKYSE